MSVNHASMHRPATPMYTVKRGGKEVKIRFENDRQAEVSTEAFIDAMRHYPPLHHVVGRQYVYEAIWRRKGDQTTTPVRLPDGTIIEVATPEEILLRRPEAASLAALGLAVYRKNLRFIQYPVSRPVYAYGYIEKDKKCIDSCEVYEYLEAPTSPTSRNVRSIIIYLDSDVLARYHEEMSRGGRLDQLEPRHLQFVGGRKPLIPYFQPILRLGSHSICIYPFEAYIYNSHPLLHEAALGYITDPDKRKRYEQCLKMLVEDAKLHLPEGVDPVNILVPRRVASHLTVTTPPRFSPQYRGYLVGSRVREAGSARIGGLPVRFERLDVKVAIILESSRAYIRGRLVAPPIRLESSRNVYFGDIFDTQALRLRVENPSCPVEWLAARIMGDDELRSKLAYHVIYRAVRKLEKRAHDENVQYIASKLWKIVRAFIIAIRVLSDDLGAKKESAVTWAFFNTLYGTPCPSNKAIRRAKRELSGDVQREGYDALVACIALMLASHVLSVNVVSKKTLRRCEDRCEELKQRENEQRENVCDAVVKAYELLAESRHIGSTVIGEYVRAALRHTLVHWVMAMEINRMGLNEGDVEATEEGDSSVIYEMYEGGVGASRSAVALLSNRREALRLLSEWIYSLCVPMAVQYQLRSILSNPSTLARLWGRLHGAPRDVDEARRLLASMLGSEPQPSVVERVEEMTSSVDRLIEGLTLHALIDYVRGLTRLYPRPRELAMLYAYAVNNNEIFDRLVDRVTNRVVSMLREAGISVNDIRRRIKESLRRIFGGRTTLEELLETQMAEGEEKEECKTVSVRSVALAMEEYGGLWWMDGHPICHGVMGCGRLTEERDINDSFAYLSPRILELLTGQRQPCT